MVRIAFMPNLTHAQALTGTQSGRFAAAFNDVEVKPVVFNSGPAIVEALFAGEVDVAYVGPAPAINAFVRSRGQAVIVVAGSVNGGARFVVRRDASIHTATDLHGKRIASPQIGNSQDVSLRHWLDTHGLASTDHGGDVAVFPLANADILMLMRRGEIDGAWVPEPWAARILAECDADVFLDERTQWKDGRFPTTLLVARRAYAQAHPETIARFSAVHAGETDWVRAHPEEAKALISEALVALAGKDLPRAVLDDAFSRLAFDTSVPLDAMRTIAQWSHALGYLPSESIEGMYGN